MCDLGEDQKYTWNSTDKLSRKVATSISGHADAEGGDGKEVEVKVGVSYIQYCHSVWLEWLR